MRLRVVFFSLSLLLAGCAVAPRKTKLVEPLDAWIARQSATSWTLLQRNISPVTPKVDGGPKPVAGIVVAGLSRKDPDYYFHWIRDSSNVMQAVVEFLADKPELLDSKMDDFLLLSQRLQVQASEFGMGEPRYTVTAGVDTSPWSRPQYDGPALRALTVMSYLDHRGSRLSAARAKLARDVLKRDLDFIATVTLKRGFDIWEEYRADNYNTRVVQLAALEKGQRHFKNAKWQGLVVQLESLLDDHWDPARGFLRSQLAIAATDGWTSKKTDMDSAVLVSCMDADRDAVKHSVLDPHVQATVAVLENLFRDSYPINHDGSLGIGFGRYSGDTYYGGNPWPLITAVYAQMHYRLASKLMRGEPLEVSGVNWPFISEALHAGFKPPEKTERFVIDHKHPWFAPLTAGLVSRGDLIMKRLQSVIPDDGDIYEQFDKVTGAPVSSRSLSWAHANFLAAVNERAVAVNLLHQRP